MREQSAAMSEYSESRVVDGRIEITRYEACSHLSLPDGDVEFCNQCNALVTGKGAPYLEEYDRDIWASADSAQEQQVKTSAQSNKSIGTFSKNKIYLIHSCFTQFRSYQAWLSQKRPKCRCRLRIDEARKEEELQAGRILPLIVGWETNLTTVPTPTLSDKEFVYARRSTKTPRVPLVDAKHIYRAYDDNKEYAKQRIEDIGKLTQKFISDIHAGSITDPDEQENVLIPDNERCKHGLKNGQCSIC